MGSIRATIRVEGIGAVIILLPYYFGGSLLWLEYNGPKSHSLIIKPPIVNLLSKAQITRNCEHSPTQWKILQHELCLARQAAALSGQRQSRSQTWTQTQEVIQRKSAGTEHL